ncbi:hypothetical protein C8P68_10592 [Mucilaginibacter yixingensis]|uniref:DUF5703 domain-containing protein n=1 Tax=Mucilaginibacter yixingensis TaxID=1295612 RepID=A0A2T5J7Z1_9SPHI|nr:DUF5703 domain-containing protein [Mucilaginibacter yixingensis]PTQ95587.1 hypothetical protein C8P68_10592 [Mucilaginibacter yixingensis]
MKKLLLLLLLSYSFIASAQKEQYNLTWTSQSKNSSESMPCGGGDIGLNVWVEQGNLYCYIARSGTFDQNNAMLKAGRVRIKLSPNPFEGTDFKQELQLQNGSVVVSGKNNGLSAQVNVWVDVFRPVIHFSVSSNQPVKTEAAFESWRYKDRPVNKTEKNQGSQKFAPINDVKTLKDQIAFKNNGILFYHHNLDSTIFDFTVNQEGMDAVKADMFNPLKNLTFGGMMTGKGMKPAGTYTGTYINTDFEGWKLESASPTKQTEITVSLHTQQTPSVDAWQQGLNNTIVAANSAAKTARQKTIDWWQQYWQRSFVEINTDKSNAADTAWQVGRNYQLFRYMLGCNAYGQYPTKFNGGLFTYDPVFINKTMDYTPDFRNWGGGLMTAQNQRLVYYPMLRSGDFDMMPSQFKFYTRSLHNAELRSKVYWNHGGACFTEQIENFGLPNAAEYNLKRPAGYDKGVEYNAWLEYTWDTVFEFCQMMLMQDSYAGKDVNAYIPFVESCLTFFDDHYQYLASHRGAKTLDGAGHLVLYPGSAAETFKMAYNANSTIGALQTITARMLALPEKYLSKEQREKLTALQKRIPPITFRQMNGHTVLSPALSWERVNNVENMQFYTVFPWSIFGLHKPGLDTALNTWKYDTLAVKFRSGIGWKQDNIFAARLGQTKEAARLTSFKLKDSGRRFPAFWGPGFDWTPDHNWGGSGMIGLQEMLMQTDDQKIYLFPAWPKDWDVHFKLHAPQQTTVEATLKNGKVVDLKVWPESRRKDIVLNQDF